MSLHTHYIYIIWGHCCHQREKPLPGMLVPHMGSGSTLGCSTSYPAPYAPAKTAEDGSRAWAPVIHMGVLAGVPGFALPSPAPAIAAI